MSHLSPREQRIVAQEIQAWIAERLVAEDLGAKLLERYPHKENKTNVSGVISLIGSILIGLGTLLFVASNWQQIAVAFKLLLILGAIVASHYSGWRLRFEPGKRPKLGSALFVLGSLFYGAGIWLIAQIFNIDTNFADGILIWALGTVATTAVVRSVPLACMSSLLFAFWAFAKLEWSSPSDAAKVVQLIYFSVSFAASLGLARLVRSRAVTWIALLTAGTWMVLWSSSNQAMLPWGTATFGAYLWCKEKRPFFSSPFLYVSTISILSSLLGGTFHSYQVWSASVAQIVAPLFLALTALLIAAWRVEKYRIEALVAIILTLAGCLTYGYAEGATRIVSNILLLSTIAGLIYTGLHRLRAAGVVNVAIVFFVFDVIARYFDFFFTMMDRSMFFIIGGIVLMIVGAIAESGRRKLLEDLPHNRKGDPGLAT